MELRHLRYFVVVAEEQNVTRAAARLHVSQPPLSRAIRQLEFDLGVDLFARDAKSLRLTEAGKFFLNEARVVLARAEEAIRAVKDMAKGRGGDLHVGYAPSLTVELLPAALKIFQRELPDVRVHLHDQSTEEMLCGLDEHRLQVALSVKPTARELAKVVFEPLFERAACVAMAPAHPLAKLRAVPLGRMSAERFIAYSQTGYPEYHLWLAEVFRGLPAPEIVEEHDSSTSLIAAVEAGRGVALIQEGFGKLSGPRLKVRAISPESPRFVFGLAYRKGALPASAEAFVKALKAASESVAFAGYAKKPQ